MKQAEIVEGVERALRDWGKRLEGKGAYVKPGASNPTFKDVPDPKKYITQDDRKATRELFSFIAQHAKLLRRLLNIYGCHEYIRPKIVSMLDAVTEDSKDTGGLWCRAREYAGEDLCGGPCSVPDELAKWAQQLRAEAGNAESVPEQIKRKAALRPVSLRQFLNEYLAESLTTASLEKNMRDTIQRAHREQKIELPVPVKKVSKGQTPRYKPEDLYARWESYLDVIPDLPNLRPL